MKTLLKILILFIALGLMSGSAFAQGNGNDKKKDKTKTKTETKEKAKGPPPWAPAHGYKKRHIYFPDQKVYYDNTKGVYIHMVNGKWEVSVEIPLSLKNVDLKLAAKIELDMDDSDTPQLKFEEHLKLYPAKK